MSPSLVDQISFVLARRPCAHGRLGIEGSQIVLADKCQVRRRDKRGLERIAVALADIHLEHAPRKIEPNKIKLDE